MRVGDGNQAPATKTERQEQRQGEDEKSRAKSRTHVSDLCPALAGGRIWQRLVRIDYQWASLLAPVE